MRQRAVAVKCSNPQYVEPIVSYVIMHYKRSGRVDIHYMQKNSKYISSSYISLHEKISALYGYGVGRWKFIEPLRDVSVLCLNMSRAYKLLN